MERRAASGGQSGRRRRGAPPWAFEFSTPHVDARDEGDEALARRREEAEFELWCKRNAIALQEERAALDHRNATRARQEWVRGWLDAIRIVRSLALTALAIAAIVLLLLHGLDDLSIAELLAKLR